MFDFRTVTTVVFDVDGTLIDSLAKSCSLIQQAARSLQWPERSLVDIRRRWGSSFYGMCRDLWPQCDHQKLREKIRTLQREDRTWYPAIPGAVRTIQYLKDIRRKNLGIHTNRGPDDDLHPILEAAGFIPQQYFQVLHYPTDFVPHKPALQSIAILVDIFLEQRSIRNARNLCLVSDLVDDGDMALRCGCRFIGVLTGASSEEDFRRLREEVPVVPSVAELPNML